jgi:hypothetical protein
MKIPSPARQTGEHFHSDKEDLQIEIYSHFDLPLVSLFLLLLLLLFEEAFGDSAKREQEQEARPRGCDCRSREYTRRTLRP